METKTQGQTGQQQAAEQPPAQLPATTRRQEIGKIRGPRLPYHPIIGEKFGVDVSQWKALTESLYPLAKTTDAVCLALSYCKARKLDIMKKPVHIVPMWNAALNREVETVWPAITEHRITAHRTGQYAGTAETEFGPLKTETFEATVKKGKLAGKKISATVTFPEFAQVTVFRLVGGHKMDFPGPRCYWKEFYGFNMGLPVPNARWARAPSQMIEKCAEAGALRKAFTEEIGNEPVAEEMEGRIFEMVMDAMKNGPKRPEPRAGATADFAAQNETHEFVESRAGEEEEAEGEEEEDAESELPDEGAADAGAQGSAAAPAAAAKPDRGAEWLDERLGELKGISSLELLAQKDGAIRKVIAQEQREADLLPKWIAAHDARKAELAAAGKAPAEEAGEKALDKTGATKAISEKDQAYEDWKGDQYTTLKNAKMTRTVDDLQDMVLNELREPDRKPWVEACNARAKELLQKAAK